MKTRFILAVHVWRDGPAQALRDYLIEKEADFMWISHPLYYSRKVDGSGFNVFRKRKKAEKKYFKVKNFPLPVKYLSEALLNIGFVLFQKTEKDCLYIGYNSLNAFGGIILRSLGKVSKVVYYCVDYTPKRFENKPLNLLFHKMDQFCVKHADETWNLNERAMAEARMKYYGLDVYKKGYSKQKDVPMGFWKERIGIKNFNEINKKQIVFMGSMLEKQGVQFVIKALPKVLEKIPDVKFLVIGSGAYLPELQKLTKNLNLEDSIEFTGFVESHKEIERMLVESALSIAIYEEGNPETNFTYYTDQGKIKSYLGCGLPILLSGVPPISKDIESHKCGIIIGNDPKEIAEKIVEIISNGERLKSMRENVLSYRNKFDWNIIFDKELNIYLNKPGETKSYREAELIFCSFVPVGLDDYAEYFAKNFRRLTYLKWKFPHSKGNITSEIIRYGKTEKISSKNLFSLPTFSNKLLYFSFLPVNYLIYFSQSLSHLWKKRKNTGRIFFGINYFCAFCGIVLKKMGRVDFVIYRVMDFFPLPPKGAYRILNRIFYTIDKFCLKNADSIWFTTEGHIIGRENYDYFDRKKFQYLMIPLGINPEKFSIAPINESSPSLVYCGVISKYHMLGLLFQVFQELKNKFGNIKLKIIGSGPDEEYFKDLSRKMKLDDSIVFYGYMEEGDELRKIISESSLGVALYKDEENFMRYTEPAKVKYYLSFGIPSIISDVPVIARELDETGVSLKVINDKKEIVETVGNFLGDIERQKICKQKIAEFIKEIDINNLLDDCFKKTFND